MKTTISYKSKSYTPEQLMSIPQDAFRTHRYWHRFADGRGEYRSYRTVHVTKLPPKVEVEVQKSFQETRLIFPDGRVFSDTGSGERFVPKVIIRYGTEGSEHIPDICFMRLV